MTPERTALAERLSAIDLRIAEAARRNSRAPEEITRIVVTKFHPAALVRDLVALGVSDVGENRAQELIAKEQECRDLDTLNWHFIGQAQTNKARVIREASGIVHSVDRIRLVTALDRAADEGERLDVLIQINLTKDPDRGGVAPDDLDALSAAVAEAESLRLRGVMAVAPLGEEPAPAFAQLAKLSERVRTVVPDAAWISAGMTGDFEEAIAHGATHLRIGSAITGPRPIQG